MKIQCRCGARIVDQSDGLSDKAYLLPDEGFFELLDAITNAVRFSGPSGADKEAAADAVRELVINLTRCIYQCVECGRLYIDGPRGTRVAYEFIPANDGIPHALLAVQRSGAQEGAD